MSEDRDADEIRVRVEQWRHFVSRRTVDDVAAGHAAVGSPPPPESAALHQELHGGSGSNGHGQSRSVFGPGNGVGHAYGPGPHGQRAFRSDATAVHLADPVEARSAAPHRDAGRPLRTDDVLATARRTAREPHSGRTGRHRIQAVEIAVWLLTGAIVVAVSLLFSRAMP